MTRLVTSLVFLTVLAYALVRYVIVGPVAPSQVPVFIINKALAVGAIVLVAMALSIGPLVRMRLVPPSWIAHRKGIGVDGFVMAALHSLLSVATLSPARYAKLHDATGVLSFEGGLVVLGGVLAIAVLVVPALTSATVVRKAMAAESWQRAQRLGLVALAIGLLHVAALGWRSWLAPQTWPGGLPPLTMIGVVACTGAFAIRAAAVAVLPFVRERSTRRRPA